MINSLTELFIRDLTKLKDEINAYADESKLWITAKEINNSAGTLCLHLVGNLKHFLGATLGNTGFVRDRDAEFTQKNVPRAELVKGIDEAIAAVKTTLDLLDEQNLAKPYPIDFYKKQGSTAFYLLHFSSHLNYHLGQINYHRRLLS
ncbi:MAG: DUF1572 domain-containing protein [Caldithrix sp.]|nr:MAG: DUF1572 domain-containing protein [Caldithrix sp.]TDI93054.1 MAG: DUF1572 domain-containing protein [Caldithrix sp.]